MRRLQKGLLFLLLVFGSVATGAAEEITAEMVEAGGGLQQYGHELEQRFAARVGGDLAGLTIESNGYSMFPPTLSYRLRFDTEAFFTDLMARVKSETGGDYADADLAMAYVLVFEREGMLRKYLGHRVGAALCEAQPERSAIDVGYGFNLAFYHADPLTFTATIDGREETQVRDRIGRYKHSASSCRELALGVLDAGATLDGSIATMLETIDNGMARRRYEIIDSPDDAAWRERTLALLALLK